MPDWIPNGGRGPLQAPWPVTLGDPTDFGLLGIATNIHEWCADWHDKDYYSRSPELNPTGPDHGVRLGDRARPSLLRRLRGTVARNRRLDCAAVRTQRHSGPGR